MSRKKQNLYTLIYGVILLAAFSLLFYNLWEQADSIGFATVLLFILLFLSAWGIASNLTAWQNHSRLLAAASGTVYRMSRRAIPKAICSAVMFIFMFCYYLLPATAANATVAYVLLLTLYAIVLLVQDEYLICTSTAIRYLNGDREAYSVNGAAYEKRNNVHHIQLHVCGEQTQTEKAVSLRGRAVRREASRERLLGLLEERGLLSEADSMTHIKINP